MVNERQIAVIIGIGEIVDRSRDPAQVAEPIELAARAVREAATDAGAGWLDRLDSIDLVAVSSWRYSDPVQDLCQRLEISPAARVNSRRGGETPIRLLHEAAAKVVSGERIACGIVGAEAANARARARKARLDLPWTPMPPRGQEFEFPGLSTVKSPLAERYDMLSPARIYPLYETACQAAWKQKPAAAHTESALLWEKYADAAKSNPNAWTTSPPQAEAITAIGPDNRLINWPYPKWMVANPSVNQSAAFIVTTLAEARAAGVAEDRLIYFLDGAAANEPDDFLQRDRYDHSPAQDAVLSRIVEAGGGLEQLSCMELYSCFPVVPKMALRSLGIALAAAEPSVTGGLTFFGGPLHNYMSHAICAMVRKIRAGASDKGMLYGQGGYVTKHHAVLLGTRPPAEVLAQSWSVQAQADEKRRPAPPLLDVYSGVASIEAFTVRYTRDGLPEEGTVVLRTPAGQRTMAFVPSEDDATMALLTSWEVNPVGMNGMTTPTPDGRARWTASEANT